MKTSRVKAYYQDYMWAVNKYGYRDLCDCYKNPSWAKVRAEREIVEEICNKGGYGYSVISYNISMFTCGYLYRHNGDTYFVIHTPTDRGMMLIEEN